MRLAVLVPMWAPRRATHLERCVRWLAGHDDHELAGIARSAAAARAMVLRRRADAVLVALPSHRRGLSGVRVVELPQTPPAAGGLLVGAAAAPLVWLASRVWERPAVAAGLIALPLALGGPEALVLPEPAPRPPVAVAPVAPESVPPPEQPAPPASSPPPHSQPGTLPPASTAPVVGIATEPSPSASAEPAPTTPEMTPSPPAGTPAPTSPEPDIPPPPEAGQDCRLWLEIELSRIDLDLCVPERPR